VYAIALALGLVSVLLYARACAYGFINLDDHHYIIDNAHVHGLSSENVCWAWSTLYIVNWHPLTWISWQADHVLYGLDPRGYHFSNALFHAANAVLLFWTLYYTTGEVWASALAAALFAWHPLRVESVAWAAERKDVLSGFFGLLTIYAYARYARRPNVGRYVLTLTAFVLGLLSKSILVTLPCVLLLLDYWPLARWQAGASGRASPRFAPASTGWLMTEKVPMFLLAAASSLLTLVAQRSGRAVVNWDDLPDRIENAVVAYVVYVRKAIWPTDLGLFYPFPKEPYSALAVGAAAGLLVIVSVVVYRTRHRDPWLLVGWLWYLGTLVPVLGIVEVLGEHALADRYTYVPLMGLSVALAWSLAALGGRRFLSWTASALGAALAGACLAATWVQQGYWHDSITLWQHTLDVTADNYGAHRILGDALLREGRLDEAIEHYRRTVQIQPGSAAGHRALGSALTLRGATAEAIVSFQRALKLQPHFADAELGIADALTARGRVDEAVAHYQAALRDDPELPEPYRKLGFIFAGRGDLESAVRQFKAAVAARPDDGDAFDNLGLALTLAGRHRQALDCFRTACQLRPQVPRYRYDLARVLMDLGRTDDAHVAYADALRLAPDWPRWAYETAKKELRRPTTGAIAPQVARRLALQACDATGYKRREYLDLLAATVAAAGKR
jgi:tetratricopeptide (TPR) repeat protein